MNFFEHWHADPHSPVAETSDLKYVRLLLLVRSLSLGGAEVQLGRLALGMRDRGHAVLVVTLYQGGVIWNELLATGIACLSLGKRSRWDLWGPMNELAEVSQSFAPDVVYSFMPAANILAALCRQRLGNAKLALGIRAGDMNWGFYGAFARMLPRMEVALSSRADLIICNSNSARRYYAALGCDDDRLCVIPNGIDADTYSPDSEAREQVRREFNVGPGTAVIGLIARLDPVKGHDTFLRVARRVRQQRQDVQFWCVGSGDPKYVRRLQHRASRLGVADCMRWLGERTDMRAIYSALDVSCLASHSESFPNVVAESMACGTPCVSLDVGDASRIVGDPALVVRPGCDEAFAVAVLRTLDRRVELRDEVRMRIKREFTIGNLIDATEKHLAVLLAS